MNALATHIVDFLLTNLESEKMEEINEPTTAEESMGIGHEVNDFDCILNGGNKNVQEPPKNESPLQKKNVLYNLMH